MTTSQHLEAARLARNARRARLAKSLRAKAVEIYDADPCSEMDRGAVRLMRRAASEIERRAKQ